MVSVWKLFLASARRSVMGRNFPSDIDEPDAPFSTHFFRSQIALKLLL